MEDTLKLVALATESLNLALASEPSDPAQIAAVCRLLGELGDRVLDELCSAPSTMFRAS